MHKKYDALCVGMALVNFPVFPVGPDLFEKDVYPVQKIQTLPGGDAANQAIVLSKLGNRVALISKYGEDTFGQSLLSMLREMGEGIDTTGMRSTNQEATCVCAIMVEPDGQRHFCTHRGALNTFDKADIDLGLVRDARLVSIGGLMTLPAFDGEGSETLLRHAKEAGAITVADTKKDLWGIGLAGIRGTLRYTDYFFPSILEAQEVSGKDNVEEMARVFLDAGAGKVGIKLGGDGCYFTDGVTGKFLPAVPARVVDTTGAGDNFMAGFITGILSGRSEEESCILGMKCGALCIGEMGPCTAVKSLEQVLQYEGEKI